MQDTGLRVASVLDQVSRAKAGRRIVLLDACRERLNAGRRAGGADPESAMGQAFQEAIAAAGGQVILAGSTTGGYAYDDDRLQNGVFSAAVMEGLQGKAEPDEEGLVKVKSLAEFVNARVRQWVVDNRPADVSKSKGITVNLEGRAADLPLAVSAERLQALEAYKTRCRAALKKLRQNLNGFITGAMYDEISQFLSCEDPGATQDGREELLMELEQLDGTSRSQRILVDYYRLRREALLAEPENSFAAVETPTRETTSFLDRTGSASIDNRDRTITDRPDSPGTSQETEKAFWESIENSQHAAKFERYLQQFPNGTYAGLARLKLDRLRRGEQESESTSAPTSGATPPRIKVPPSTPTLPIVAADTYQIDLKLTRYGKSFSNHSTIYLPPFDIRKLEVSLRRVEVPIRPQSVRIKLNEKALIRFTDTRLLGERGVRAIVELPDNPAYKMQPKGYNILTFHAMDQADKKYEGQFFLIIKNSITAPYSTEQ